MKKKRQIKRIVIYCILFLLIGILSFSIYNILFWQNENKKTEKQIKEIEEISEVKEITDSEKTEIINPPEKEEDPYWDYIKTNLIDVDFTELKNINQDVVGWIQVNGTNVNYPFVQTTNNTYYLNHQLDNKKNTAGWVFLDYRNSLYELNNNTIIYAHGRMNNTMFGSLRKTIKQSWYQDKNNHIIKISTEQENTLWQIFSSYRIKTTNDYIQTEFSSNQEYLEFLKMIKNRSVYNYNVELNENDKILTLSTCYDDNDKLVLHAKLIKREKKEI